MKLSNTTLNHDSYFQALYQIRKMQLPCQYHNTIELIQSPSNRHLCRLHISSFSAWANLTDKDNICFLLGCEYQRQQTYWIKQTMKEFVWKLKVALLQKVTQATIFGFTFQKPCIYMKKPTHPKEINTKIFCDASVFNTEYLNFPTKKETNYTIFGGSLPHKPPILNDSLRLPTFIHGFVLMVPCFGLSN